ncbi:hypothetical protein [Deminuibacter soli]|uniref:Energy transducer TonB n=1 Tax=Deminuibacter soli TaxID=2291815 RepID=A0A3E1NJ67_9BACT|nr:hypothetical protein [Deminuibacter soli]RFM27980.1 hypothetical protein DXN05_10575 [Deminuibacter soli]
MEANFESKKNLQALGLTAVIIGVLALLLFVIGWTLPQMPVPVQDEGIEVNLGNSDQGQGDIAPAIPGEASAEQTTTFDPPPSAQTNAAPEETKPVEESKDPDATPIHTPDKPSPKPNPKHTETSVAHKKPKAVVPNPTPVPPKPKAVYAGGKNTGNGGNGADSYNGVRNQGIAGGKGDQGKPNGNPNSDSYTGNGGSGKSGVSIRSGLQGRRITHFPSFQDDFNENAKVAVDVSVNESGTVTGATVNPRGTTTTNTTIRSIAIRKAQQLKFNTGGTQQTGTIVFDFKLN